MRVIKLLAYLAIALLLPFWLSSVNNNKTEVNKVVPAPVNIDFHMPTITMNPTAGTGIKGDDITVKIPPITINSDGGNMLSENQFNELKEKIEAINKNLTIELKGIVIKDERSANDKQPENAVTETSVKAINNNLTAISKSLEAISAKLQNRNENYFNTGNYNNLPQYYFFKFNTESKDREVLVNNTHGEQLLIFQNYTNDSVRLEKIQPTGTNDSNAITILTFDKTSFIEPFGITFIRFNVNKPEWIESEFKITIERKRKTSSKNEIQLKFKKM